MPTVLIPYEAGDCGEGCQDIFVYLRPETNGILVESTLMKVVQKDKFYLDNMELVYLANLPGGFMKKRKIIEHHYRLKIRFCIKGKQAFTDHMRSAFEIYYDEDFDTAKIIGGFEALEVLHLTPEELSKVWVDRKQILVLNGQCIKKYRGYYIVNYDIPAIMEKNDVETDIAVMVFRTPLPYGDIHRLISEMADALKENGLLPEHVPLARVFHYSKGPFEQISDAMGYLYRDDGTLVDLKKNHFVRYLMDHGFSLGEIRRAVLHPIMGFTIAPTVVMEDNLIGYTFDDTYEDAMRKFAGIAYQLR